MAKSCPEKSKHIVKILHSKGEYKAAHTAFDIRTGEIWGQIFIQPRASCLGSLAYLTRLL